MMLGRITILVATSVAAFAQDAREAEMVGPHQICNQGNRKMPGAGPTRSGSGGNTDRRLTDIYACRARRSKRRSTVLGVRRRRDFLRGHHVGAGFSRFLRES
jgi:hypothetical protein